MCGSFRLSSVWYTPTHTCRQHAIDPLQSSRFAFQTQKVETAKHLKLSYKFIRQGQQLPQTCKHCEHCRFGAKCDLEHSVTQHFQLHNMGTQCGGDRGTCMECGRRVVGTNYVVFVVVVWSPAASPAVSPTESAALASASASARASASASATASASKSASTIKALEYEYDSAATSSASELDEGMGCCCVLVVFRNTTEADVVPRDADTAMCCVCLEGDSEESVRLHPLLTLLMLHTTDTH